MTYPNRADYGHDCYMLLARCCSCGKPYDPLLKDWATLYQTAGSSIVWLLACGECMEKMEGEKDGREHVLGGHSRMRDRGAVLRDGMGEEMMELKVKLTDGAPLPRHAKPGDAGLDLTARETVTLRPGETRTVGEDVWCIENYPAQADVVNVSNMRHLYLLDEPPEQRFPTEAFVPDDELNRVLDAIRKAGTA